MSKHTLVISPKGDDGHKDFSIRVKDELVLRLEELVKQTGRSRNELIGILLEYALDNAVIEDKSKE